MPRRPWSLCCPPCDEDQDSPPQASRRRDGGEGRLLLGVGSQASSSKTRGRVASRSGGSAFYCLRDWEGYKVQETCSQANVHREFGD